MLQDFRYALRSLASRPLVTTVAVLSLALGIGVNTAIFSVFERLLLRRLPVTAPEQIVNVTSPGPKPGRDRQAIAVELTRFSATHSFAISNGSRAPPCDWQRIGISAPISPSRGRRPKVKVCSSRATTSLFSVSHRLWVGCSGRTTIASQAHIRLSC